jgi:hypothetical protein
MSDSNSDLSPTGFDYVVAVTQDSINATLAEYLYQGLKEAILCYAWDDQNPPNLLPIDYNALVANAKNTDPFAVPDGTPGTDQRVQNLDNAGFAFAIKAKLGLPPGVPPSQLPPIVALKPGQSNVMYTLLFAEFVGTEIVFGPRNSMTWVNVSQPSGTSWTFSGAVDLNFQTASFDSLPPEVQARLKDLGDPNMFSVQQLYYDLNNSDLEQGFQFNNVPPNSALNTFMTGDFINTYWKALGGNEVLGYGANQLSATPPSSIAVTNLNFFTPDAVGDEGAPLTLNYLCSTNHDPLPDTTHAGFGWNWIGPGEVSQYDGAVALNRNAVAQYLNSAQPPDAPPLFDYVSGNCYHPWVHVWYDSDKVAVDYSWNMTPQQQPTVSYPSAGNPILTYSYSSGEAADQAGVNGALGQMKLSSTFDLSVSVQGNQIMIVQHLVIYTYVSFFGTGAGGNVVDKQITDTYTIGVNNEGQIVAALQSSNTADNSQKPGVNDFLEFFTHLNELVDDVEQWAEGCATTSLTDVPVSFVQSFIFPGGATFSFADAGFSDNQDLVSHITYAEVT